MSGMVESRRGWTGDYLFLLRSLILKEFRVRYRNMSLGIFWSVLNPLVMMGVLWFVFTKVLPNRIPHFAVFVLCGIVPYNVFTLSWLNGTNSLVDNAHLVKRVPVPREILPMAAVLSNCVHLLFQMLLLLAIVLLSGLGVNVNWWWLIVVWSLEIVFVMGLSFVSSALNVYVKDVRYVVESANVVLFWLVPIFYDFSFVPQQYRDVYQFNPVAALVLASRNILLEGTAPSWVLLMKLTFSSILMLCIGMFAFRRLQGKFYNYL
jgi:ABC-type polysaccharide/polyol phosphate export permease